MSKCIHGLWDGTRTDGRSENCELCFDFPSGEKYSPTGRFLGIPRQENTTSLILPPSIDNIELVDELIYDHSAPAEDDYSERSGA